MDCCIRNVGKNSCTKSIEDYLRTTYLVCFVILKAGVLVIAFPVSVFSDLWSKELSRRGAFNSLVDGVDNDDDIVQQSLSPSRMPPESARSLLTYNSSPNRDYVSVASAGEATIGAEIGDIVMRKEDLDEIVAHLNTISESHRQVRMILRKCKQQYT